MRLISLIIAVLLIGLILQKQLGGGSSSDSAAQNSQDTTDLNELKVPTKPGEIKAFEQDLNAALKQQNEETRRRIEEAEKSAR